MLNIYIIIINFTIKNHGVNYQFHKIFWTQFEFYKIIFYIKINYTLKNFNILNNQITLKSEYLDIYD